MGETVAAFTVVTVLFHNLVMLINPVMFLFFMPSPNFLNDPQLRMSLECQQEEASQHSEAGSRLPWRCGAGAALLGGFSRSASEL